MIPKPGKNYGRLSDLKRLREHAIDLPVVVNDNGVRYVALVGDKELYAGRHEVLFAYLQGWKDAIDANGGPATGAVRNPSPGGYRK